MSIFHTLLDLLFPPSKTEQAILKRHSRGTLRLAPPLPRCSYAMYDYKDPLIRKSVRTLKTRRSDILVSFFANALHEFLIGELDGIRHFTYITSVFLVPIPITKKRRSERGFNQAELLAKEIAKKDPRYVYAPLLIKTKETAKQATTRKRKARHANLKESMKTTGLPDTNWRETLVVVIDDVITTGATMNEAKRVLRKAGSQHIWNAAIAH